MSCVSRVPNMIWRVLSIVITVLMVVSLIAPFTAQRALALDVPLLLHPENSSETTSSTDPPLGVPTFSWTKVAGATRYRLQVDNEIGFNSPITMDILTPLTSYTPASVGHLFADGRWYWRVRVDDVTTIGEWSDIWDFTKKWASINNAPALLAPTEGQVLAFFDAPTFSWERVSGAAKYRFQIAAAYDGFGTPVLTQETLSNNLQPANRLANGIYFWRVIPMDLADHLGTASEIRSFTMSYGTGSMIPIQLEPANWSYPTFTPTFRWTAVEGADLYRLEYTSDETCDFGGVSPIITRQTFYTPLDTFPNDKRYCWRVRVESGTGVGDWSDIWYVQKRWYLQPHLLTPTNLYQTVLYPVYSWTPVPGAAYYRIEVDTEPSFTAPLTLSVITANTTFAPGSSEPGHYYWRVTAYDGGGKLGKTSLTYEFISVSSSIAPSQVYPLYYYIPNNPIDYGNYTMNPVEDRTVAYPMFMWQRVMNPTHAGGIYAAAYRIEVATSPYFLPAEIKWRYETENTSATPTLADNFIPEVGPDNLYYWRVCPLTSLVGDCEINSTTGEPWWSQVWVTRFDPTYTAADPNPWVLKPATHTKPDLLRPAHGQEAVEATPMLEWWPMVGATQYQVVVSREQDFATDEISVTVGIPAYSPVECLVQRNLDRIEYGTFYWRVRAYNGSVWTDWSDIRRFQIASQSDWRSSRLPGDPENRLVVGEDPLGDASDALDLNQLYAVQSGGSSAFWYIGFNADITTTDTMNYILYVDVDHLDGSGATFPPVGPQNMVRTILAHRPEYAIVIKTIAGVVSPQNTWVYAWNGVSGWYYGQRFIDIGAFISHVEEYVELAIPYAAIGMSNVTNSVSLMLLSVDNSDTVIDSVPSDPQVPAEPGIIPILSRFSSVSDRMNLIYPPDINTGDVYSGTIPMTDTRTVSSLQPFYWDWPVGSDPSTPYLGSSLEVHLDPGYTNKVRDLGTGGHTYDTPSSVSTGDDIVGDNIYYWRVQPIYYSPTGSIHSTWTSGWSFRRVGFKPENLQTTGISETLGLTITIGTPTFFWDMTEGASKYHLQYSTDPYFSSAVTNIETPLNSYTPENTLTPAIYYWRVHVTRYNNIANDWSPRREFDLRMPAPSGLTPDADIVAYAPTMCWDKLVWEDEQGIATLAASKYRVQVSQDPSFSTIYDNIDTIDRCWTPTKGYHDGTYYWHVAMIDGNSKVGSYSLTASFTKQYPTTILTGPPNGANIGETPTFSWTPVDGAATYVLEVSKFPTFSPLYESVSTINTQYTPTIIYTYNTTYYWRVAIKDRDGSQGPFTGAVIIIDAPITGLTATNDSPTQLGSVTHVSATITSGTYVSYVWNYGDGTYGSGATGDHVYPAVGAYTAIVTATNTVNSATATTTVTIVDVPISGLHATNNSPTELGSATTLSATIASGTNVTYSWTFGDGTSGSGAVVNHTYPRTGNFTAKVTAQNGQNTVNTTTVVHIDDAAISGLVAQNNSPTYQGDPTLFTATITKGSNVSYAWNFGDGSHGTGANPSHTYASLGEYTAVVTATNPINSMTASTLVHIIEEPISGLVVSSDSPTYIGDTTHFTATISTGTNVTYAWAFGDGASGSGAAPTHTYSALGEYTAVVTATNSLGQTSADTHVSVVEKPISGLTAINDSPTELGSMTALTATISGGTNVSYIWSFGDGAHGSGAVTSHTYSAVGLYTATVTTTNSVSSDTADSLVVITDIPIGGLTATNDSPTSLGETTTLTASISAGTGVVYTWDFGDGESGNGRVVTHVYTEPGNFTATVTATNLRGSISTSTQVAILPPYYYMFLPIIVK